MKDLKYFSKRLKEVMDERNVSNKWLEKILDLESGSMDSIMSGKTQPSPHLIKRICWALEVPAWYLGIDIDNLQQDLDVEAIGDFLATTSSRWLKLKHATSALVKELGNVEREDVLSNNLLDEIDSNLSILNKAIEDNVADYRLENIIKDYNALLSDCMDYIGDYDAVDMYILQNASLPVAYDDFYKLYDNFMYDLEKLEKDIMKMHELTGKSTYLLLSAGVNQYITENCAALRNLASHSDHTAKYKMLVNRINDFFKCAVVS